MKRIALIFSFNESNWVSCQKIVYNLHQSYQLCQDIEIKKFNLPYETSPHFDMKDLVDEILDFKPDVISIIDHKPHPLPLLTQLSKAYSEKVRPELYIHLFGDFTLYFSAWSKLDAILTKFPVKFFVASDRQKIFIDNFLQTEKSILCPFPVDTNEFQFNKNKRIEQRAAWGVSEEDKIFIYTGRLSRQKRIKSMIRTFSETFETNANAKLFIYGHQDHVGDPFIGIQDMPGEYFRVFYRFYKSLPQDVQKRILFKGQVSSKELQGVYQGADCLINLSVHNDEDFGMSVAEAQSTGMQSILSSWAGLRSFNYSSDENFSLFCRTKIGDTSKLINIKDFKNHLTQVFNQQLITDENRMARAELSQSRFSIQSVGDIISQNLKIPASSFQGFSSIFQECATKHANSNFEPMFLTPKRTINKLYKRIYSAYADETT